MNVGWELRYQQGTSDKFYRILVTGTATWFQWGRRGSYGELNALQHNDHRSALEAAWKQSGAKEKKGYRLAVPELALLEDNPHTWRNSLARGLHLAPCATHNGPRVLVYQQPGGARSIPAALRAALAGAPQASARKGTLMAVVLEAQAAAILEKGAARRSQVVDAGAALPGDEKALEALLMLLESAVAPDEQEALESARLLVA